MVKIRKKKSFRTKVKVVANRTITNLCEGLSFTNENCKDFLSMSLYRIKSFGYYFAPSTIRFKLMTSVKFLKIKKRLYTDPVFRIKRFFFYLARYIKDVKSDIILYFKKIFIKHWKLTICTFVICLGTFLLDYHGSIKIGLSKIAYELTHSPNQKNLFDLYVRPTHA